MAVAVARVLRADRPARDRDGMVRGAARFTCLASRGGAKLKEVPRNWFLHVESDIKDVVPCGSGGQVVSMIRYLSDPFALASAERKNRKGNFGTTPTMWSLIALGIYHRLATFCYQHPPVCRYRLVLCSRISKDNARATPVSTNPKCPH